MLAHCAKCEYGPSLLTLFQSAESHITMRKILLFIYLLRATLSKHCASFSPPYGLLLFFHHVFSCSSTQAYFRFLDWFPISPRYSVIWQLSSTQHFIIWSHSIAYATLKEKKRLGFFFTLFFLQQRFHPQRYVHAVQMKLDNVYLGWTQCLKPLFFLDSSIFFP